MFKRARFCVTYGLIKKNSKNIEQMSRKKIEQNKFRIVGKKSFSNGEKR